MWQADEGFAVCRVCGYYAKLGHFVEVDLEMEGFQVEGAEPQPFRMPKWAIVVIAGSIALIAESITVAVMLPENTFERLCFSLLHLIVGLSLVIGCHIRGSFMAMMDDSSTSFIDCMAWPPKIWMAIAERLPKTGKLIALCGLGFIAVLMSVFVLRAIPYSAIFEGQDAVPEYNSVIAKVLKQAKENEEPEMSLEEAIESFADTAEEVEEPDDEELDTKSAVEELTGPQQVDNARAIVMGFYMTEEEPYAVTSVVLASANRNPLLDQKIEVLGVMPVTDQALAHSLLQRLWPTVQDNPIAETKLKAFWVKPSVRCEVSYLEVGEEKEPTNIQLQKLY